jgi:pilus assembly protein CpaB
MNLRAKATASVTHIRRLRPNRTWALLLVALTIGGLAAMSARSYLTRQMEAIEATAKGKTVTVIVAKQDIPKGEVLSAENMALRPIPAEFAHSVALSPEDFERVDGQRLAYPVKSGEMILWGLMETARVPTFSANVAAGRRAMTVPVDEINSISGMLEPGDTIDLLATIDRNGKKSTFPVMQSVAVMATGQRSQDDPKTGDARQYTTVTIDTTPEQAKFLIAAREAGRLTALLRNPQDKAAIPGQYDVAALLGMGGAAAPTGTRRVRTVRQVPVLYGGNLNAVPPSALRLGSAAAAAPAPAEPAAPVTPAAPADPARPAAGPAGRPVVAQAGVAP